MIIGREEAVTTNPNGTAMVFTDGACIGNPGPGGYAAIILIGHTEQIITGRDLETTNNRMELLAPIRALEELPQGIAATIHPHFPDGSVWY